MKIEGYAKEIADFFALGYYSEAYFKIKIECIQEMYNNGKATVAKQFPSDPPKHGEDCRLTCKNKQTFTGTLATTLDGNFIVVDKNSLTTL